jgi:hypothetical protein
MDNATLRFENTRALSSAKALKMVFEGQTSDFMLETD